MRQALGVGAIAAIWALAPVAVAQVTPDSMLAGRQARKVEFQLNGAVEHDTNITRTTRALAAAQGLVREDTIFTPTLNVDLLAPVGRQAVFLRGSAGYLFHARNKRLDSDRYDLEGGVGNLLGPCGSILSGAYQRGRSELQDRSLVSTINNIIATKTVSFGVTCVRPPGLGITGAVAKAWTTNSQSVVTSGDFQTTTANLGFLYSRPTSGSLTVQGQYAKTVYDPVETPLLRATDGYESYGGGVRVERRLGGRIQAVASLSYMMVDLINSPSPPPGALVVKNFSGLTYSGELSFRASSRLQAQLKAEKSIQPTLLTGSGYEIQTQYSSRLEYRIGSRISVAVGAELEKADLRGALIPGGLSLTNSTTRVALASVSYRQSDRLTLSINGHLEDRTANDPRFEYTSERVGASANVSF